MTGNNPFDRHSERAVRAVVIDRNRSEIVYTTQALQASGRIEVISETSSYSIATSIVERHKPDYVFISIDEESLSLIETIRDRSASIGIVAMGSEEKADLVIRSYRAGADEYLVKPFDEDELDGILERLSNRKPAPVAIPETDVKGRVLAFLGSRGGCGTTTLAINTAHLLSQSKSTVLVDLHFGQGDLPAHIDIQTRYSLRDIIETADSFDQTLIDSVTVEHESGLRLLLQPDDDQPFFLREEGVQQLVFALRQKYAYVVLDLGCDMETASAVAPYVDDFLLVLTQDVPSVYMAVRKIQRLAETGYDISRLFVAVNAYSRSSTVTLGRIAKTLERRRLITVREDVKNAAAAINQGILLARVSRWGKAMKDIVRLTDVVLDREPIDAVEEDGGESIRLAPLRSPAMTRINEQPI